MYAWFEKKSKKKKKRKKKKYNKNTDYRWIIETDYWVKWVFWVVYKLYMYRIYQESLAITIFKDIVENFSFSY